MQFRSKQGQILHVTVQANGDVQMGCAEAKFFATFFPENAQAIKKFLVANLPEVVENPDINLNPKKDNVNDGDEEMEQNNNNPDASPTGSDVEETNEQGVQNV